MWADTEVVSIEAGEGAGIEPEGTAAALTSMLQSVAEQLTDRAVDGIYPMRIADITAGGKLILNQGSNRLAPGDMLEVFLLGERIEDPYSGESLGREETKVGSVEVQRVTSKVAYADPTPPAQWLNVTNVTERDYVVRSGETTNLESDGAREEAPPVLLPQDR